jgi:alpha/beta superfamily hydrolase
MRGWIYILLLLLTAIASCAAVDFTGMPSVKCPATGTGDAGGPSTWSIVQQNAESAQAKSFCTPSENYFWYPNYDEPYSTVTEEIYLTSTNGMKIFADVHRPFFSSPQKPCHGLVLIPGGIQKGEVWHVPHRRCNSYHFAGAGFITMDFDCQGRGKSEGVEDYNGPVDRGDLKTVIDYIASRPDILPGGVGLVSTSFGSNLAVCTLAEYPDLAVKFYIDFEGSQNRYVATKWDDPLWVSMYGGHTTSDDAFWSVREAITCQPYITLPYIRIQTDWDHLFDSFFVDHAIEMINAAVDGESPYVRLNHEQPNIHFNLANAHDYQWEDIDDADADIYFFVLEASTMTFP